MTDPTHAALNIAAEAVRVACRNRRSDPDGCPRCVEDERPILDALDTVARDLDTQATAAAPTTRDRLARHLYLHDVGTDRRNEAFWAQASEHLRARYERRAEQILAVITGKDA